MCCWKPAVSGFPWLLLRVFLLPLLPREGISLSSPERQKILSIWYLELQHPRKI